MIAARFIGPLLLERGRSSTTTCPLSRDGQAVEPDTTGLFRLYRPDGSRAVESSAVVVDGVATASVPDLIVEALGEGWAVEWALPVGGPTLTFRRSAALCRRLLYPVLTDADLLARHSDLAAQLTAEMPTYQSYIDSAWEELLHLLRQRGHLPYLVSAPEDLRWVHLYRTLEMIFLDFQVSAAADSRWAALADRYRQQGRDAWNQLSLRYETTDDAPARVSARAVVPVTFLC